MTDHANHEERSDLGNPVGRESLEARDREYWDRHASRDPLWAIVSDASRTDRRWDVASFMERGERDVALLLRQLRSLGVSPESEWRVLDFGCGVGRTTQAFGRRFGAVVGLDVSPRMIRLADELNRYPDTVRYGTTLESVSFNELTADGFDLIYCVLVLQHMDPAAARARIATLMDLLRPGGVFVFQMPAVPAPPHAAPTAMEGDAYQAFISSASPIPGTMEAGRDLDVPIRLMNGSGVTWDPTVVGSIRAGNHWLSASGRMVLQDDGRCSLPDVLAPGAVCDLVLTVRVPTGPGDYVLEIDAVHEGVTWFADRGSRTLRAPVVVAAPEAEAESGDRDRRAEVTTTEDVQMPDYSDADIQALLAPVSDADGIDAFPMHGIPQDEVLNIVLGKGGQVLDVVVDDHAKPEWIGYQYIIRASDPGSQSFP